MLTVHCVVKRVSCAEAASLWAPTTTAWVNDFTNIVEHPHTVMLVYRNNHHNITGIAAFFPRATNTSEIQTKHRRQV